MTDELRAYKRAAAERALDEVASGMLLGLGTGSTAQAMLRALGERLRDGRLRDVRGVPTSEATACLARELRIPLTTLDEHPDLDLTLDGTDEVDARLDLIKGLGGALLREKIVASASRRWSSWRTRASASPGWASAPRSRSRSSPSGGRWWNGACASWAARPSCVARPTGAPSSATRASHRGLPLWPLRPAGRGRRAGGHPRGGRARPVPGARHARRAGRSGRRQRSRKNLMNSRAAEGRAILTPADTPFALRFLTR